eukprot:UN07298
MNLFVNCTKFWVGGKFTQRHTHGNTKLVIWFYRGLTVVKPR